MRVNEIKKFLIMFSRFKFREAAKTGDKRPRHDSETIEVIEPIDKSARFELDESDDESSVVLREDLVKYARKYSTKHFSDKAIKEKILTDFPVPNNLPKPPKLDIYIKELVNETVGKARTTRVDGYLLNIQQSIRTIMGPVAQLWSSVNEEKDSLEKEQGEDEEQEALRKAEIHKLGDISKTLDSVVALVGQATQRTSYYRRHLILESLLADNKQPKTMLNDWESALEENTSKYLFGDKFEEELCRSSKTKKKSKDIFKGLLKSGVTRPFRKGPLPTRGGRGQSSSSQTYSNNYRGGASNYSKNQRFQFSNYNSGYRGKRNSFYFREPHSTNRGCKFFKGASACKVSFCGRDPGGFSNSREDKALSSELECFDKRSGYFEYSSRVQGTLRDSASTEESSKEHSNERGKNVSCRQGGAISLRERGNKGNSVRGRKIFQFSFLSGEEGFWSKTSDKLKEVEFLHSLQPLQNGGTASVEGPVTRRGFYVQNRFKGRLLCGSSSLHLARVRLFQLERETLSICMPMFWACTGSFSVHQTNENSHFINSSFERKGNYLPRRHLIDGSIQGRAVGPKGYLNLSLEKSRLCFEYEKIGSGALSTNRVPGYCNRFNQDEGSSSRREDRKDKESLQGTPPAGGGHSARSSPIIGEVNSLSHSCSTSSLTLQGDSEVTDPIPLQRTFIRGQFNIESGSQGRNALVDSELRFKQRTGFALRTSSDGNSNRCLQIRLGSSVSGAACRGPVVRGGEEEAHKCVGTKSSAVGNIDFHREIKANICTPSDGQHLSVSLHSENGGHSKSRDECNQQGIVGISTQTWDHNYSRIPPWDIKRSSRQGIKEEGSKRMEAESKYLSENLPYEGSSRNRFVCLENNHPAREVLLLEARSQEPGDRCLPTELERSKGICLPSILPDREGVTKSSTGGSKRSSYNSSLAISALVSPSSSDVDKEPHLITKVSQSSKKPSGGITPTKPKQHSSTGGMDSLREDLFTEGVSKESAELILLSRRSGTSARYESAWRKFCGWCSGQQIDPFRCPLTSVLQFLTDQLKEGREYNTIAGYRSAISAFHKPIDGCSVGNHPRISALMKGIFNKKPPKPKYRFIWDVDLVLGHLEALAINDNLGKLTHKLVMLLALTSASRASEIWQLDLDYMIRMDSYYSFTLPHPTKVQKQGDLHTELKFYKFDDNKSLCVFRALDAYIEQTKSVRGKETKLLIATIQPHHKVVTSTVSRWLKEVIRDSGIEIKHFQGHSTRSASTSKALLNGASIEDIMHAAHWSNISTFQKFYNNSNNILVTDPFREAVLK